MPPSRRLVRHLRLVESVASLHRSLPDYEPARHSIACRRPERPAARQARPARTGAGSRLDRIGKGTSCEVYRTWDTALHREVALKLLHDEGDHTQAHARLLEEARRLARVVSHVVQVYVPSSTTTASACG